MYLVKIRKTDNVQEFVVLYFGPLLVYQNSFDNFWHEGPQMRHAKFGANHSNCLGGVRKSTFFICRDFANGKLAQKWAWPTSNNSVEFREHIGMRFNNVIFGV